MDLVQTHTSMANDVASNGIQNGKSCSDVWLVHGGNMIDCLLGAVCRCQCSAGVPATMRRRVGLRICQGARGSRRSWDSRGSHPTEEAGSEYRISSEGLTEVLTNQEKLLMRKGGRAC